MQSMVSLLLSAAFMAGTAWAEERMCVVGSTIIDVVDGKSLHERTVVIEGDRIEAVSEEVAETHDCTNQVDGSGKFLIPGLWDMHVHGTSRASLWPVYVANGVTGVRDMFGASDHQALRSRLAAAPVKPRVHMSGPLLDGPPGIWPGSKLVVSADEARQAVSAQAVAGVDFIKVYQLLSRDAYFAIMEEARRLGLPAAGHVPSSVSAREASEAGQVSIEHLIDVAVSCSADEGSLRTQPPQSFIDSRRVDATAVQNFDVEKCKQLAEVFMRNGTWMVPTLTVSHAESRDHEADDDARRRLLHFNAEARTWLEAAQPYPDEVLSVLEAAHNADRKLVSFLYEEGVPFLAGTDALNPYTFPGFSLHDELALLVESGLSPLAALQAATINPARFLGAETRLGSVEAGKLADLVLLDADPLVDIRNTTKIAGVFSDGRYFDRAAIIELLASARRGAVDDTH